MNFKCQKNMLILNVEMIVLIIDGQHNHYLNSCNICNVVIYSGIVLEWHHKGAESIFMTLTIILYMWYMQLLLLMVPVYTLIKTWRSQIQFHDPNNHFNVFISKIPTQQSMWISWYWKKGMQIPFDAVSNQPKCNMSHQNVTIFNKFITTLIKCWKDLYIIYHVVQPQCI